ncbi:hypothetical protein HAX54_006634, partial [Datura stramonium]|nr:hypothetical protein [Datura stramonium]
SSPVMAIPTVTIELRQASGGFQNPKRSLEAIRTNDLMEDNAALKEEQEGLVNRMNHIKRSC